MSLPQAWGASTWKYSPANYEQQLVHPERVRNTDIFPLQIPV